MAIDEELSGLLTDDEDYTSTDSDVSIYNTENTSKWAIKGRFKSWAVWVSILGALGVILEATGVFEKLGIDNTGFDVIVTAIGSILTAFGILNNPTDKGSF